MKINVAGLIGELTVGMCLLTMVAPLNASGSDAQIFRSCLVDLGSRLDCYFSVESIGRSGWLNNPILDGRINADASRVKDIGELMAFITNDVHIIWEGEGVTSEIRLDADRIEHDGKNIVRIRDAKLVNVAGYALTNSISLEYEGTIDGLLRVLSSKDNRIQAQKAVSIGAGLVRLDTLTRVQVSVVGGMTRDVLTTCIPLANYHRIVWSSYTDGKAETPVVMVKFYGQE